MNHKPIDYSEWNFDGTGKNIVNFFLPIEKKLWNVALPYQDKRDDIGHAENVTYFALKLVEYLNANREVIIPAAILHDIGWSRLPENEISSFYSVLGSSSELELRLKHQKEGSLLAQKILEKVKYPNKYISNVIEIISQHDTRKGFFSEADGLVRDADKLWRFTLPCWYLVMQKIKTSLKDFERKHKEYILQQGYFYSDIAKEIARIELENTINFYQKK
jgi:putative nucleotidyltransferase with HDIG domain